MKTLTIASLIVLSLTALAMLTGYSSLWLVIALVGSVFTLLFVAAVKITLAGRQQKISNKPYITAGDISDRSISNVRKAVQNW
jgi:Na+/proline symporter